MSFIGNRASTGDIDEVRFSQGHGSVLFSKQNNELLEENTTELTSLTEGNHSEIQSSNSEEVSEVPVKANQRIWTVILSAIVACIPFLLVGSTLGFPSGVLLDLADKMEERPDLNLSTQLADVFGALGYIGAILGGPIAGWVSDRMGRKPALMLVSIPYLIGYMMIAYAHLATDAVVFKVILLIGRFFSGVGLGWASLAVVVYVAEISPAKHRGKIASFLAMFMSTGILVVYLLSTIENFLYYNSAVVLIGFVTLFTFLMLFLYETPPWLLSHHQKESATAALKFLRGPKFDIRKELNEYQSKIGSTPHLKLGQLLREFTKGNVIVPVVLVLFLVFFTHSGGATAVISYSALILKNAGVQDFREIAVYGTGCARIVINFFTIFVIDCLGRKVLLIVSSIGTFLGTTLLGVHFYITRPSSCLPPMNSTNVSFTVPLLTDGLEAQSVDNIICNIEYAPLAIVAIVFYNVGVSLGWGPIIWVLLGELLPIQVRGIGTGIATFLSWGLAALVVGSYLSSTEALQPWFVWWAYSVVNLTSIFFVGFCIFETKGKTLKDIQHRFETKYGHITVVPSCIVKGSESRKT